MPRAQRSTHVSVGLRIIGFTLDAVLLFAFGTTIIGSDELAHIWWAVLHYTDVWVPRVLVVLGMGMLGSSLFVIDPTRHAIAVALGLALFVTCWVYFVNHHEIPLYRFGDWVLFGSTILLRACYTWGLILVCRKQALEQLKSILESTDL